MRSKPSLIGIPRLQKLLAIMPYRQKNKNSWLNIVILLSTWHPRSRIPRLRFNLMPSSILQHVSPLVRSLSIVCPRPALKIGLLVKLFGIGWAAGHSCCNGPMWNPGQQPCWNYMGVVQNTFSRTALNRSANRVATAVPQWAIAEGFVLRWSDHIHKI